MVPVVVRLLRLLLGADRVFPVLLPLRLAALVRTPLVLSFSPRPRPDCRSGSLDRGPPRRVRVLTSSPCRASVISCTRRVRLCLRVCARGSVFRVPAAAGSTQASPSRAGREPVRGTSPPHRWYRIRLREQPVVPRRRSPRASRNDSGSEATGSDVPASGSRGHPPRRDPRPTLGLRGRGCAVWSGNEPAPPANPTASSGL